MREVLKIFRLFLIPLTLVCVECDDRANSDAIPTTIANRNNGKVNISSLAIVEGLDLSSSTTQQLVSPDVDETSGVANSGISTSGAAKRTSDDDVSALGGKEILYSNVVNDEGTATKDYVEVRTEITVVEEINGREVRRKPTEQELKSLSHVEEDEDDVQDMSAILKLDPELRKPDDEYFEEDDDNIEDMTSIFEESAETTTLGYTRKVVHIYKNTKEFKTFSNVSEGDPFEDDATQESSTINVVTTMRPGYREELTTTTTSNGVPGTTSLDDQSTTTIRANDSPTTNVAVTATTEGPTQFTTEVPLPTETSTSVDAADVSTETLPSGVQTTTTAPSRATVPPNETISTTIRGGESSSEAKEQQPSLTSSEVESIYNTQLEEYDSDEEVGSTTTTKESIAEEPVPAVLAHRILSNPAVFSIKISKKDKTFYVPAHAVIAQNDSAVTIAWKGDGRVNDSVVLRVGEHDKYHVIKEIQLNIFRDGEMFNQRKLTAFTPAHPEDDSVDGRTRIVMMRDGTYVQFSNVDFLKKPDESETAEAATRSTRMWHLEVASICLTIVVLVAVTVYVVAVKVKQRHHSRKKVGEVLDTRC